MIYLLEKSAADILFPFIKEKTAAFKGPFANLKDMVETDITLHRKENTFSFPRKQSHYGYFPKDFDNWLVVLGQLSFITTLATLVITARLKRFDRALEEAAMDLGASRIGAVILVTFRFLAPAIFSAAVISFIYSFNNFNTTYFLIGTKPTLPVLLYSRLRFGITPQINAVSVLLMIITGILGMSSLLSGKEK